jgi:hypothetical protein
MVRPTERARLASRRRGFPHATTGAFRAANHRPLLTLLEEIRETTDVPMIGFGGVMTGRQAYAVLSAGAIAVQLGTAFLVLRRRGPLPLTGRGCGMRATPNDPHSRLQRTLCPRLATGSRKPTLDPQDSAHRSRIPCGDRRRERWGPHRRPSPLAF